MKVAIYTRVSTLKQVEDGYSLDAQLNKLKSICELNNYSIYKIYTDEGISGKDTIHRPAYQEMMQDMKDKKFNKILVMKLDRLSRSLLDLELLIKELKNYNCDLISANEDIDTSSSIGMVFVRLLGTFAQFERERISERINDAFEEKVKNGTTLSGLVARGYMVDENKKVVKNPNEEQFIKDIFNHFKKTHSLSDTAKYVSVVHKDITNGKYDSTKIKKIITNEIYYGKYKNNENFTEPYLTKQEWLDINALRKTQNIKTTKHDYLYSTLLKCPVCGHKLVPSISVKFISYRCNRNKNLHICSFSSSISEKQVEQCLIRNIEKYINVLYSNLDGKQTINTNKIKLDIKDLQDERKRVINSYQKGWINEYDAENQIINIDRKINKLESLPKQPNISDIVKLKELNWNDVYSKMDVKTKKLLWLNVIDYIEIDYEKYKNKENDFLKVHFLIK